LINHGADPNLRDSQGFNGLHLATHSSNSMLVLYLIYQDMDIDTPDTLQHTPLMWAAYQGDPLTLDLLIRLGASISKVDTGRFTPLHWAVTKGNQMCLRKLIEAGADTNAKEDNGKTPMDLAREMNVEKVWNRALSESGRTKSGKRKTYLFGQVSYKFYFYALFSVKNSNIFIYFFSYFETANNANDHIFHSISCPFFCISNINSISVVYWVTFSNRRICWVSYINSKGSHKSTCTGCNDENTLFYEFISSKCFLGWRDLAF